MPSPPSSPSRQQLLRGAALTATLLLAASSALLAHDEEHHSADQDEDHHATLHFSHPLVTESPSPDTKVRLDVFHLDLGGADEAASESTFRLEAEYAFHPTFSIEVDAPFTTLSPDQGDRTSRLDTLEIAFKAASFTFADRGVLLGYGLELGLPTGDDRRGIGSDHLLEIGPFFSFGWKRGRSEVVSFLELGIPTRQRDGEEVETEVGLTVSYLRHLSPRLQAMLELDGSSVLSGESGGSEVNLSPGVKVRPLAGSAWWIGASLGVPISSEEAFDSRLLLSAFYHF